MPCCPLTSNVADILQHLLACHDGPKHAPYILELLRDPTLDLSLFPGESAVLAFRNMEVLKALFAHPRFNLTPDWDGGLSYIVTLRDAAIGMDHKIKVFTFLMEDDRVDIMNGVRTEEDLLKISPPLVAAARYADIWFVSALLDSPKLARVPEKLLHATVIAAAHQAAWNSRDGALELVLDWAARKRLDLAFNRKSSFWLVQCMARRDQGDVLKVLVYRYHLLLSEAVMDVLLELGGVRVKSAVGKHPTLKTYMSSTGKAWGEGDDSGYHTDETPEYQTPPWKHIFQQDAKSNAKSDAKSKKRARPVEAETVVA